MMATLQTQREVQTSTATTTLDDGISIGELFDALATNAYRTSTASIEEKEQLLVDEYGLIEPLNLLSASAQRNELTVLPDASNATDVASLLLHDAFINRESLGYGLTWSDYLLTN